MKLKFIALCAISMVSTSFAVQLTMPDAKTLEKRLAKFESFINIKETDLIERLANQVEYPSGAVLLEVERIYTYYHNHIKQPTTPELLRKNKSLICKALLQDSPEGFKELQDSGWLQ